MIKDQLNSARKEKHAYVRRILARIEKASVSDFVRLPKEGMMAYPISDAYSNSILLVSKDGLNAHVYADDAEDIDIDEFSALTPVDLQRAGLISKEELDKYAELESAVQELEDKFDQLTEKEKRRLKYEELRVEFEGEAIAQ